MSRRFLKLPVLCSVSLVASVALAAPRDNAASKKIDEAINTHYLATDFKKAEDVLLGTIKACEDKCSPEVLGRAWMYVGLVRSGKGDMKGAQDAFATAVATDPNVKLDADLASAEAKSAFEAAGGGGSSSGSSSGGGGSTDKPSSPPSNGTESGEDGAPGSMTCTPESRTIQTGYPIPVACTSDEDVASAELRYKPFGETEWKTLKMKKRGESFQALIPCADTAIAGEVKVYVRGKDKAGEVVDSLGTKSRPISFKIVPEEQEEAPSFPDRDPEERCAAPEECPPDLPGCGTRGDKKWGDSCSSTQECSSGLQCTNGQCEEATSCEADSDCASGQACVSGVCESKNAAGKNLIGLHFGLDVAFLSGEDVCSKASQADGYACFASGTEKQYSGRVQKGNGGSIAGGAAPGTMRLMLSYDRLLLDGKLGAGVRVGFAFNGGPASGGTSFLPLHFEPRATYFPLGTSAPFRPYVHLGGGLAQVDAMLEVRAIDCTNPTSGTVQDCQSSKETRLGRAVTLDAYRKLGQGFLTAGGGAQYMVSPNMGAQLNLNLMYMLPTTGLVVQPSIGGLYSF